MGTAFYDASQFNHGFYSKINEKVIDFTFREKVNSYQGSLFFEFNVYLPSFLTNSSNFLKGDDDSDVENIDPSLCKFVLKKSINDFLTLNSHIK